MTAVPVDNGVAVQAVFSAPIAVTRRLLLKDTAARPQTALRKDAARNRCRIMDAARALASSRKPLQLNAVAQAADVGVGTVYRDFPTPEALIEALAEDRFTVLIRQATAAPPTPQAYGTS